MSVDNNDNGKTKVDDDDEDDRLVESKNYMKTRSQSLQSTSSSMIVQQSQQQQHHHTQLSTITSHLSSSTLHSERSFHKTSTSSSQSTKSKFQSFLQQPDAGIPPHAGGTFLSVQQNQKFRQFVRSASTHSDGNTKTQIKGFSSRSSSTQMEDDIAEHHLKVQQDNAVLISKSAESLETKTQFGQANRSQLTLSGGFLAPPNRKLTILSPVHSTPGLHEILKRQGRSPISPRITFPGSDNDLFM